MKGIPDYLEYNLKVVFVGFNPGLTSAATGHHYAGQGNRFWKLLAESELTPRLYSPEEDYKLLKLGLGLTNIVTRPTRRAEDLTAADYEQGRKELWEKLKKYQPEVACYTGIGVYREFSQRKKFPRGFQSQDQVEGVKDFVVSSPSGLNRIPFEQQLSYYVELNEYIKNSS